MLSVKVTWHDLHGILVSVINELIGFELYSFWEKENIFL